jgi:hypothetical protein
MTTLATFRTNVSGTIGLTNSGDDQTKIDGWLNQGYLDVLVKTACKVQSATASVSASEGDYTLDTDILKVIDIYLTTSGTDYRLERATPAEILEDRRNASTSTPVRYAVAGADLLMLYPIPDATGTLTFYYVARPSTLSLTTDEPSDVPAEWQWLIEFYALWRAADFDDDTSSDQGSRYKIDYEAGVKEFRRAISGKGGKPAKARVRNLRYTTVPSDPSRTVY